MRVILLILIGFSFSFARVVVDKQTGLMWQDSSDAKSVVRTFEGAKSYCKELRLDGHSDWFLPTHEQLLTITDKSKYDPAIKSEFKNVVSSNYWSSSSEVLFSKDAWSVYFEYGDSRFYNKTDEYYVRCARAGQYDTLDFDKLVSKLTEQELKNIPAPPSELKLVKEEFETTAEFNKRVESTKRKQKEDIKSYRKKYTNAKANVKQIAIKKALQYTWGKPKEILRLKKLL